MCHGEGRAVQCVQKQTAPSSALCLQSRAELGLIYLLIQQCFWSWVLWANSQLNTGKFSLYWQMLAPKGKLCALPALIKQTCPYARNPPSFFRSFQFLGWHWLKARPPLPNEPAAKPTGEAEAPHSVDKAGSAETSRIWSLSKTPLSWAKNTISYFHPYS